MSSERAGYRRSAAARGDSIERLAAIVLRDGAGGVVFGRNAIQATDPRAFIRSLQKIVKQGIPAAEAL